MTQQTMTDAEILRQIQTQPSYILDGVKYWVGHRGDVYYFDEDEADRWVNWLEKFCTKVDADYGEPLVLMQWHRDLVRELFGWKRVDNKRRRYRRLFLMVPRKNAKTLLMACIALGMISIDGENRAQAYISAAQEEQAKIMFSMSVDQVEYFKEKKPYYGETFEVRSPKREQIGGSIWHKPTQSFMRPLTKSPKGKHGFNVHFYAIDEWHEIEKGEVEAALRTGTINRKQPLGVYTTTAGNRINTPAHRGYLRARKVKLGQIKQDNYLVVIYEPDKDDPVDLMDDWDGAINTLKKICPGWGITVDEQVIKEILDESVGDPIKEAEVKCYLFNQWENSGHALIRSSDWMPLGENYSEKDLLGRECIGGLDCASNVDTNAFVLIFPEHLNVTRRLVKNTLEDGSIEEEEVIDVDTMIRTLSYFWVPEKTAKRREHEGDGYEQWIADGFMRRTEGGAVDMAQIRDDILKLKQKFKILEIGYDPHEANWLVGQLLSKGLLMTEVVQTRPNLSGPTKVLQQLVLRKRIRHNNNDVLTTHVTTAVCKEVKRKYMLEKPGDDQHIDGAAALVDALKILIGRVPTPPPMKPAVW